MRKKEDPWNSIIAGAATGGFAAASTSAVMGGHFAFFDQRGALMFKQVKALLGCVGFVDELFLRSTLESTLLYLNNIQSSLQKKKKIKETKNISSLSRY